MVHYFGYFGGPLRNLGCPGGGTDDERYPKA